MDIGQKVRFKSTGKYASVHMKRHVGTIVKKGDPAHPQESLAIDVKCETCTMTHYTFEHYVSPVNTKTKSA